LKNDEVFKVTGQLVGSPTYVPHLVKGIKRLVKLKAPPKIVNISGSDVMSRWGFACVIAKEFGYPFHNVLLTMNGNVGSAPRPRKAGLKLELAKTLQIPVFSVQQGLKKMSGDRIRYEKQKKLDK
jgi:dTDP-4-dehydrorhamnose reductase